MFPLVTITLDSDSSDIRGIGDVVTVHGDGLRMRYRHDALALIVAHVRDVELQNFGNQRTAP